MSSTDDDQTRIIRTLNNRLRRSFHGGRVMLTRGIRALPPADQAAILERVRRFDDFPPGDYPYGEHDFGAFDYQGTTIF